MHCSKREVRNRVETLKLNICLERLYSLAAGVEGNHRSTFSQSRARIRYCLKERNTRRATLAAATSSAGCSNLTGFDTQSRRQLAQPDSSQSQLCQLSAISTLHGATLNPIHLRARAKYSSRQVRRKAARCLVSPKASQQRTSTSSRTANVRQLPRSSAEARGSLDWQQPKPLIIADRDAQIQSESPERASPSLEAALSDKDCGRAHALFMEAQSNGHAFQPTPAFSNSLLQLLTANFDLCWEVYMLLRATSLHQLRPETMRRAMDSAIKAKDLRAAVEIFRDMQQQKSQPGIITWCYLISSLNKDRRKGKEYAEVAYKLWRELAEQPRISGNRDGSYFAAGMQASSGVGKMLEAEDIIADMQDAGIQPDIRAYNILLTGYSRQANVKGVERVFRNIRAKNLKPSSTTYNILLNAYINAKLHTEAHNILKQAKDTGFQPDLHTYSTLIKEAAREGDLESAATLYKDMLQANIQPSVVTMNTLVDGYVRAERLSEAEDILKDMEDRGVQGNVVVYNTLLRGYARAGKPHAVRDVVQRMSKSGIQFREDTFNTLMTAALENDNTEVVPNMFSQLLSLNLRPDSLSYTALITALSRLSRPEAAMDAANQLEKQGGLDIIAINALVAALATADRIVDAEKYLRKAVVLTQSKGLPPPIEAYGALVKAYARLNDARAALDLLTEFQQEGGRLDERMVSMGVTACVRAGEFKQALKFVRAMEKAGKNVDKARIKNTLVTVVRLQEQFYRKRSKQYPKNEHLERFKFWLGLPNQYYPTYDSYDSS